MSKIKINFEKEQVKSVEKKIPLFYTYKNSSSLYMLLKEEGSPKPYRVVSIDNGHMQSTGDYYTIDEFLNDAFGNNRLFVDLEIHAKFK